jgi:hypothetical protein
MSRKYEVKEDSWYTWKGVKPPERQPHLTEEELSVALEQNIKNHLCDWVQRGNSIECEANASFTHGKVIGTKLRLDRTDENGKPILVPLHSILRQDVQSA